MDESAEQEVLSNRYLYRYMLAVTFAGRLFDNLGELKREKALEQVSGNINKNDDSHKEAVKFIYESLRQAIRRLNSNELFITIASELSRHQLEEVDPEQNLNRFHKRFAGWEENLFDDVRRFYEANKKSKSHSKNST